MRLEQYIFTGCIGAELSTAIATEGISLADRGGLEKRSVYFLPPDLLFQRETEGPAKYLYYSLDENRSVIGKAIYAGRDSKGRPGKYFFHNFVVRKDDLISCDMNPVALLARLDSQGLFLDSAPGEYLEVIDVPEFNCVPASSNMGLSDDAIGKILYFCHNCGSIGKPLLILGVDRQLLDFLNMLYNVLPLDLRSEISFDTYCYGSDLKYKINCLPIESQFQLPVDYALRLDLRTSRVISTVITPEPGKMISFATEMISAGHLRELNVMYKCQYLLQRGDSAWFKERSKVLAPKIRDYLIKSNRSRILHHLSRYNDPGLLGMIIDSLEPKDIEILSQNRELITDLVDSADDRTMTMFVSWLYRHKTRTEFYPLLFRSPAVLKMFLGWIGASYYDLLYLADTFKLVATNYSVGSEELFMDKIISLLRLLKTDRKLVASFCETLRSLPAPQSEKLAALRLWVEYEISGNTSLLDSLANANTDEIPEKYRDLCLASIRKASHKEDTMPADQAGFLKRLITYDAFRKRRSTK